VLDNSPMYKRRSLRAARFEFLALALVSALLAACAGEESRSRPRAAPSSVSPGSSPGGSGATSPPVVAKARFDPEPYGRRLRAGAPAALRARFAVGQEDWGAIHDAGPVVNGHGHGLTMTAEYGAYRDARAPCPGPWETIIRWAGPRRSQVWQARVAPEWAVPTNSGFIIPATACLRRGVRAKSKHTADWFIDPRGRIGELHLAPGSPPVGIAADAPMDSVGEVTWSSLAGEDESLLVARETNTVWAVPRHHEGVGENPKVPPPAVFAQDVTGRRWVATQPGEEDTQLSWTDDEGATWEGHGEPGSLLYSDRTIGYLHSRSITVTTDRGRTWVEHRLPSLKRLALPNVAHPANWEDPNTFATRSGTLVLVFEKWARRRRPQAVVMRSTDASWTRYETVGPAPGGGKWNMVGDTLSTCWLSDCYYSKDLGKTWHNIKWPE